MGKSCCAPGCRNGVTCGLSDSHDRLGMYAFPDKDKDSHRRKLWIEHVPRGEGRFEPTAFSFVCSEHFTLESFEPHPTTSRRSKLKDDAVPTLFEYNRPVHQRASTAISKRVFSIILTFCIILASDLQLSVELCLKRTASSNSFCFIFICFM